MDEIRQQIVDKIWKIVENWSKIMKNDENDETNYQKSWIFVEF